MSDVGSRSITHIIKDAWKGQVKPTQAEELAELVAKRNIKVSSQSQIRHMSRKSRTILRTVQSFFLGSAECQILKG